MMKVVCYKGHISNFKALMAELKLDTALAGDRSAREEAILLAAYKAWGSEMGSFIL